MCRVDSGGYHGQRNGFSTTFLIPCFNSIMKFAAAWGLRSVYQRCASRASAAASARISSLLPAIPTLGNHPECLFPSQKRCFSFLHQSQPSLYLSVPGLIGFWITPLLYAFVQAL